MAKPKFDFVVEAVHYTEDGRIAWVRGFERRGPTFSDRVIVERDNLVMRLKGGERVIIGQRVPQMAGTFELGEKIQIDHVFGEDYLIAGGHAVNGDYLQDVPII
jgi:hypothetical protein